ncbi:hypothetical protein K443DRAFT_339860 [Laccaria amethystina LaAM-08-1]|uniref:Uncharacterized protein n=1 Tax=Laccaria amethystina LaAM-08-1 TaxID=1095629 RepID=A0A0C9XG08_9AGAR|nr:hypothetical protein K443DRAFT_339860 [Laccaria amethystina LaAM-08-1]
MPPNRRGRTSTTRRRSGGTHDQRRDLLESCNSSTLCSVALCQDAAPSGCLGITNQSACLYGPSHCIRQGHLSLPLQVCALDFGANCASTVDRDAKYQTG